MSNKKKNRKILIALGFFFTLFILFNFINHTDGPKINDIIGENKPNKKIFTSGPLGYTINISDSDPSKNWTKINSTYTWCTGAGTYDDPYVIQDVIIDASGRSGILIENSNRSYFSIENCTIYNSGAAPDAGIKFVNTCNGTIYNCTSTENNGYGIHFNNNCYNNTILTNNVSDNQIGIYIYNECHNNTIRNNLVNDNINDGIYLWTNCGNNSICDNDVINNNQYGIHLNTNCDNNTVSNNWASNLGTSNCIDGILLNGNCDNNTIIYNNASSNNQRGIYLQSNSKNNTIAHNIFHNNPDYGIYLLSGCDGNLFYNNSLVNNNNGRDSGSYNRWDNDTLGNYWDDYGVAPVNGYDNDDDGIGDIPYDNIADTTAVDSFPIWDDGFNGTAIHINDSDTNNWAWARTRTWCSGSGTYGDPFVIEDLVINAKDTSSGILIENSTAYFRIENCTVYNSTGDPNAGIKLVNTSNGTLIDNNCSHNNGFGIFLFQNCINNSISGNICNNNSLSGIRLYSNCDNNSIRDNIGYNNTGFGIDLWIDCDFNNLSYNINNFTLSASGIYLYSNCDNNTLKRNDCYNNSAYGIHLNTNCNNNSIIQNDCFNNSGPGIRINTSCGDNTIRGNNISNNFYNGILLYSDCDNNSISNNTIINNQYSGIKIHTSCDNNTVSDNTISFNSISGIDLFNLSKGNEFYSNTILNNSEYGIRINDSCDFNLNYNNIIGNNTIQAQDNGTANNWDNGTIGNHWGDYREKYPIAIYDGFFWLTPYVTNGSASSYDNFPLGEVTINYTGTGVVSVVRGKVGQEVNWTTGVRIGAMATYDVYINKTIALSGQIWSSEIIQFTVPESNTSIEAIYNITCVIRNDNGWEAQKQINLTVVAPVSVLYDSITTNKFVEGSSELMRWNISVHAEAISANYTIIVNGSSIIYTNNSLTDPITIVIFDLSDLRANEYNLTCNYTVQVDSKLYSYSATSEFFIIEAAVAIENLNGTSVPPFVQNSTKSLEWNATLHNDANPVKFQIILNSTNIVFENNTVWDPIDNIMYNLSNLPPGDYAIICNVTAQVGTHTYIYASATVLVRIQAAVTIVLHESPGASPIRFSDIRIVWNTTVHADAIPLKYEILNETLGNNVVFYVNASVWVPQNQVIYINSSFDYGYYRLILNITLKIGIYNISVQSEVLIFTISNYAPTIDDPADIEIFYGQKGLGITWTPVDVDANYNKYTIYIDDVRKISGDWDGSNITYILDNLTIGTYDLKCMVNDTFGLSASSVVEVKISQNLAPSIQAVSDFTIYIFDTNKSIRWTTSDSNGNYDYYEIYINGLLNVSAKWVYSRISLSLEGFKVGIYNITLVVYDTMGLSDEDSVLVTISESLPGGDVHPNNIILLIILVSAGVGTAAVIIYITRIKPHKVEVLPKKEIEILNDLIRKEKKSIKKEKLSGKKPKK